MREKYVVAVRSLIDDQKLPDAHNSTSLDVHALSEKLKHSTGGVIDVRSQGNGNDYLKKCVWDDCSAGVSWVCGSEDGASYVNEELNISLVFHFKTFNGSPASDAAHVASIRKLKPSFVIVDFGRWGPSCQNRGHENASVEARSYFDDLRKATKSPIVIWLSQVGPPQRLRKGTWNLPKKFVNITGFFDGEYAEEPTTDKPLAKTILNLDNRDFLRLDHFRMVNRSIVEWAAAQHGQRGSQLPLGHCYQGPLLASVVDVSMKHLACLSTKM